jgi:prophage regulatory protein
MSIQSTGAGVERRLRRFLTLKQVRTATGLSSSTIYAKIKLNEFPRQLQLFDASNPLKTVTRWIEDEIVAFQEARIAKRDEAPLPPPPPQRAHVRKPTSPPME